MDIKKTLKILLLEQFFFDEEQFIEKGLLPGIFGF